jgi:hypothetical protein
MGTFSHANLMQVITNASPHFTNHSLKLCKTFGPHWLIFLNHNGLL